MKKLSMLSCVLLLACAANSGSSPAAAPLNVPVVHHRSEKPAAANDSLVTIESVYKDLANNGKEVPVKGSGFLVQAGQQVFVVTASHVSQGDRTVIHHQGQDLTIKGRYYVDEHDVEVMEVTGVNHAIPFAMDSRGVIEWQGQEIGRARWVDVFSFVLLNDWVKDPNLDADNIYGKQSLNKINCDLMCTLLQATTLMQPGSSGSPLVVKIPNKNEWSETALPFDVREMIAHRDADKYFLRGLTIRRDRFFARSSFIPTATIVDAIKDYQSGRRTNGKVDATWNVSGSLIFRISDGYLYESAAVSGSSGNGISMDGGEIGDLQEENPRDVLSKISAVPVENGEPRSYWVLMMRHPTGYLMSAPLWFDMEHYLPIKRFQMGLSPDPADKDNLLNFFYGRFGRKGAPAELISDDSAGKLTFPKGFVQVETRTSDGAQLSFLLNSKAAYCKNQNTCEDKFMAVIEVPANNGQVYFVDLRGFLFMNPSSDRSEAFHDAGLGKLNQQEWLNYSYDRMSEGLQKIRLTYRRKRTTQGPLTVREGQVSEQVWTIK